MSVQVQPPLNAGQSPRHPLRRALTWAVGDGRAHVHEAERAARQRLPAAGAAGDLRLGGRAADAVLAEAAALVGHRRAAVGDGLAAEVAAHKHLAHGNKHRGRGLIRGPANMKGKKKKKKHNARTHARQLSRFALGGR